MKLSLFRRGSSLLILSLAWVTTFAPSSAQPAKSLLGTVAPAWQATHWLNTAPLTLDKLRGKVLLVRWWTAPGCPYCSATAPALNEFYQKYHGKDFEVIGFYHHKASSPLDPNAVKNYAKKLGFKFPVAIDQDWRTLNNWWLDRGAGDWTSVSFLLDRKGVIRHIHPGGQYVKGDSDYEALKKKIEELLKE